MSEFDALRNLVIEYETKELPIEKAHFQAYFGTKFTIAKYEISDDMLGLSIVIKGDGGLFTKPQALALAALIKKMAEQLPDGEGADVKGRRK